MQRICTHCGSANVRRSGVTKAETPLRVLFSPYRCRDCGERFWVISRKACVGALAASSIIASGVLVWLVSGALAPRQVPQVRASAIVTPGNSQQSLFANDPNTTRVEMQQLSESWLKNAQQAGEAKAP